MNMPIFVKNKKEKDYIIQAKHFSSKVNSEVKISGENNFIQGNLSKISFIGSQYFEFIGNNNRIVIKDGAHLSNCKIKFSGDDSEFIISNNCRISVNVHVNGDKGRIEIGEETTMARVLMVCQEEGSKILIGKDCMFSSDIFIRTSDSHSIIDIQSNKRINPPKDVIIDDHIWVGQSVKINKGVKINSNSIIANGSIVTGNIPSNTVVGGNPAKIIKSEVNWRRELTDDFLE